MDDFCSCGYLLQLDGDLTVFSTEQKEDEGKLANTNGLLLVLKGVVQL